DLDRALGRVDARAEHLPGLAVHAAGAQVAHLPRAQLADAAVADAHAAAEGHLRAGLLAGEQDRLLAVADRLDPAAAEPDRATAAALAVADVRVGLEVLGVKPLAQAGLAPALAERLEQAGRPAQERLALAPVRADRLHVVRRQASVRAGQAQVQPVAAVRAAQPRELAAEDHALARARAVHVDDIAQLALTLEPAQHAGDRRDAAAGADEEQPLGRRLWQHEGAFDAAQAHHRSRLHARVEERRDLALLDELGRDRDQPVRPARLGGERVGAPVVNAVDGDAETHVLAGPMPRPLPARLDQHGDRVGRLALHAHDPPAQLPRGPQRVDELEVVVRE